MWIGTEQQPDKGRGSGLGAGSLTGGQEYRTLNGRPVLMDRGAGIRRAGPSEGRERWPEDEWDRIESRGVNPMDTERMTALNRKGSEA